MKDLSSKQKFTLALLGTFLVATGFIVLFNSRNDKEVLVNESIEISETEFVPALPDGEIQNNSGNVLQGTYVEYSGVDSQQEFDKFRNNSNAITIFISESCDICSKLLTDIENFPGDLPVSYFHIIVSKDTYPVISGNFDENYSVFVKESDSNEWRGLSNISSIQELNSSL